MFGPDIELMPNEKMVLASNPSTLGPITGSSDTRSKVYPSLLVAKPK
jgi:hypothetical protein